ncbi:MAG: hypothetical protein U0X20_03270 [Caldilineaceae bacterium]
MATMATVSETVDRSCGLLCSGARGAGENTIWTTGLQSPPAGAATSTGCPQAAEWLAARATATRAARRARGADVDGVARAHVAAIKARFMGRWSGSIGPFLHALRREEQQPLVGDAHKAVAQRNVGTRRLLIPERGRRCALTPTAPER